MEKLKNYSTPISLLLLSIIILFISHEFLEIYKKQNNYSVIQVSSTDTIEKINPTITLAESTFSNQVYFANVAAFSTTSSIVPTR
jgi:hypothetical protein